MKKTTLNGFLFSLFTLTSLTYGQSQLKTSAAQQFGKPINGSSQNQETSKHIRCYSTEYEAFLKTQDPTRQTTQEFEEWLAPKVEQIKADRASGRAPQVIYNIPVVIHIIHNGDCIGTGENITDAQAISQIKVLNEDYRRLTGSRGGANSTGLAVDTEINFILAKRDPSGNPTNGINRVQRSVESYDNAAAQAAKAATIWDPTKYLNMWTFRFTGDLNGVLGYAQFPTGSTLTGIPAGVTTANTDGVAASYDAMGTIEENDGTFILNSDYELGRTMTHEVGHWLGLRHIWGDGTLANGCSVDDYCADTPNAQKANYDCVAVSTCSSADQYQNYMDYSYDYCMDTFTNDQKSRMVAVMTNSPRRKTLNASNGATAPSAGVYFNQNANTCSYVEATNCNFTDINYPVSIIKAPTQNTVVTFTTGGTATNNVDYEILTPSVTFAAGSTANQTLTIRYFNDGFVEPTETLNIGMTINANGGDGALIPSKSTLNLTILDNDVVPTTTTNQIILSETFDPAPTLISSIKDLDGDGKNWGIYAPGALSEPAGFTTNYASSKSWDSSGGLNPDNIIFTPVAFTLPTGSLNLSFGIGTFEQAPYFLERYSVYLTTVNPSTFTTATLNAQTAVINNAVLAGAAQRFTINTDISSYAGQTVYLVFRHYNTFDQNNIMLDDVLITKQIPVAVQTEVNTATAYQAPVLSVGTFYAKDATTGNIIADGTADAFNYGCTTVSVNRSITSAGAPAVNYGANTANNLKVMAKTVTVAPTTNNPTGNTTLKFYFTEAEIAAWESATGNSRSVLKVFKGGESTTYATTIGAFGTNVTLSASSPTGLGGIYYFGIDAALASDSFDLLSAISIYPNPANNVLNVSIPSQLGSKVNYQIFNYLGQTVKSENNSSSNFSINTSNFANGVYFIKLDIEGSTKTMRFIKN